MNEMAFKSEIRSATFPFTFERFLFSAFASAAYCLRMEFLTF